MTLTFMEYISNLSLVHVSSVRKGVPCAHHLITAQDVKVASGPELVPSMRGALWTDARTVVTINLISAQAVSPPTIPQQMAWTICPAQQAAYIARVHLPQTAMPAC